MVERGDEHEVLVEEREFGDTGHPERHGEQEQVQAAGGEAVDQARGLLLVHLEVEVRIPVVDEPQHRRQQIRRDGRDDAEAEGTGERRPDGFRLLHQRPDLHEHRLRPHGEPLAGR